MARNRKDVKQAKGMELLINSEESYATMKRYVKRETSGTAGHASKQRDRALLTAKLKAHDEFKASSMSRGGGRVMR